MKPLLRVGGAFAAIAIFVASAHFVRTNSNVAADYPRATITASSSEVEIDISKGATGSDIAQLLYENGVVKSPQAAFRTFVADPRSARIAPGVHRITQRISAAQALEQLLDVKRMPNVITIFEGEWNSEVISTLVKGGYSRADVVRALRLAKLPEGFTSTEGLLFPAHYSFPTGTPIQDIIQKMVDRAVVELRSSRILKGDGRYTPVQLLTMASMVQQEGDLSNLGKVAQVLRNRLHIGMRLQFDSTVHYITGIRGNIFLSTKSTLLKSPYNTYQRYGLPPTPIGNPGRAAMDAVMNPTPGNWLYFITVKPGETRFTDSLDEFNRWKIEYRKNLKAGAFS